MPDHREGQKQDKPQASDADDQVRGEVSERIDRAERTSRLQPMSPERWQQVCQIFALAVAHHADSRPRYLDEACGVDLDLRALVVDLLAQDEAAAQGCLALLLDHGPDESLGLDSPCSSTLTLDGPSQDDQVNSKRADDSQTLPPQASTEVEVPAVVARARVIADAVERWSSGLFSTEETDELGGQPIPGYRIVARLGEGGMGVVFKAEHLALKRFVALKMVRGDVMFRPEHLARFRVETEAIARLRHPNVVDIYEVGEAAGSPYCALELLEGNTLAQRLAEASMPPRQAAELLATIACAVHSAHRVGIVHRDLKPANVLFDSDGTAKVTDFGLAKRLEVEDGQTQTGHILGTPSYMAPEQARGHHREVGPATDVYALGATLYEMLTCRPPFKGTSHSETLIMVLSQDPVPPSRLQPRLPRDLETICLKCLAKEPARRYTSAQALADDLQRFLANRPILARPTLAWERGLKWSRRRPMTTAAASFTVAATLGLIALGFWSNTAEQSRLSRLRSGAVADLERARRDRDGQRLSEAASTLRGLVSRLASEPRLSDLAAIAESQRADLDRQLRESARREENHRRVAEFTRLRDQAMALDAERWLAGLLGSGPPCAERVRDARLALQQAVDAYRSFGSEDLTSSLTAQQLAELKSGGAMMVMALADSIASPLPGEQPARQAEEALHVLEQINDQRTGLPGNRLRRAAYLARTGKPETESTAAELDKTTDWADRIVLGQERARRGDWEQARWHLAQAFGSGQAPTWSHGLVAIAHLMGKRPMPDVARSEISIALQGPGAAGWMSLVRGLALARLCETLARAGTISLSYGSGLIKTVGQDTPVARDWARAAEFDFRAAEAAGLDAHLRHVLHITRGKLRLQGKRPAQAEADFASAIAQQKDEVLPHVLRAEALRLLNRREEAIVEIDRAIALEPRAAAHHRARAGLRLVDTPESNRDQAELALHDLDTAARLETRAPVTAAIHVERAKLLAKLQRKPEALQAAEAAIIAEPGRVEAHLLKVATLLELGKHDALKAACDEALALRCPPASGAQLRRLRGLALVGKSQFHQGVLDFTRALDLEPKLVEALIDRGWAYLMAGAIPQALDDFDEVIRLADRKSQGYSGRAAARIELGDRAGAFEDVRKAVELDASSPQVHYNAARVFARAARVSADPRSLVQRANESLREAFRKTPPERRERFREALRKDPFMQPLLKGLPALLSEVGLAAASC